MNKCTTSGKGYLGNCTNDIDFCYIYDINSVNKILGKDCCRPVRKVDQNN